MPELMVTLAFIGALVLVLSFLFARNRKQNLAHVERMAALERGVAVPPVQPERPWSPRVYLLRGLIWSFIGAALMIFLLAVAEAPRRPPSATDKAWEVKRMMDMTGVSREDAYREVEKDASWSHDGPPKSIATFGLIPLAVGLAYLLFYYTGEPRFSDVSREPDGPTSLNPRLP